MSKNNVLIVGVTSQDGAYLSNYLLENDLVSKVDGLSRRVSTDNTQRLSYFSLLENPRFSLIEGDVTDSFSITKIAMEGQYDFIINLSAQSHVRTSFDQPQFTFNVNTLGVLNILEAVRLFSPHSQIYQAGTSEQFGSTVDSDGFQRETTPFQPLSPYAVSKVAAFDLMRNYRAAYGLFACNGILFNHTSPLRGWNFLERKVSRYCAALLKSNFRLPKLKLGNLSAWRDYTYAADMVAGIWKIVNYHTAEDFVLASSHTYQIQNIVEKFFNLIGIQQWQNYVEYDENLARPSEVDFLRGDAEKAEKLLGWKAQTTLDELLKMMIEHDLKRNSNPAELSF